MKQTEDLYSGDFLRKLVRDTEREIELAKAEILNINVDSHSVESPRTKARKLKRGKFKPNGKRYKNR